MTFVIFGPLKKKKISLRRLTYILVYSFSVIRFFLPHNC
uniref:Uncharacterized protein n=1 Tax=Rhizophora mucronata TaxID=61149 RepID=A0A2P2QVR4_RHIMU